MILTFAPNQPVILDPGDLRKHRGKGGEPAPSPPDDNSRQDPAYLTSQTPIDAHIALSMAPLKSMAINQKASRFCKHQREAFPV